MTAYGFGQSDVSGPFLGHQRQAGRFVGWSPGFGSVAGPLQIRNDFNEPITFHTNSAQRMHINGNVSAINQGFVGIGTNFTAPQSRLHINEFDPSPPVNGGTACYAQWTVTATGNATANDGLRIGLTGAGTAEIRQQENLQLHVFTTDIRRMLINNGGTGSNDGRIGFGNNLAANFIPQDRLHSHQETNLFDPDFNGIRLTNSLTNATATDGSQFGISNNGTYFHRQFERAPIIFELRDSRNMNTMTNWLHIANGQTGIGFVTTDGFVGLNNPAPLFHLDLMTPFINSGGSNFGGELFISARPTDVPNSNMGMLNISGGNGVFTPSLFGNLDAGQSGPALSTIAAITSAQDVNITTNSLPVQRFVVGKDWGINTNLIDPITITNRNAFSWQNVDITNMLMNANGRLKIQTGLNPAATIDNRLVITSATNDPGAGVATTVGGSSGLQLTNLTATTPPLTTNPGAGVLGVDASGNVVYVDASSIGGGVIGNLCTDPQNPLTGHYEIPLDNFNYNFTGQGTARANVGIGLPCSTNLFGKLTVYQTALNFFISSTLGYSTAGYFVDDAPSSAILGTGVWGVSAGSAFANIGGRFEALNSTSVNIGVWGLASGTNAFAGWFDGNVNVNGTLTQNGVPVLTSDQMFKTNINNIANPQSIIAQLQPKEFYFDSTSYTQFNFAKEKQYGFIAQEVELILPELVSDQIFPAQYDSLGNQISAAVNYKGLNYNAFIAILMKGMQEQQNQLDSVNTLVANQDSINTDLETRLAELEACISNIGICNGGGNGNKISTQTVTLENLNAIVLDQNLPNPFAESTQINYMLPDDVLNAKMLFYDMNGRIINEVNINDRGNGTLTVYGENLEKGIYTYSLIADGKLIATKKMVKK